MFRRLTRLLSNGFQALLAPAQDPRQLFAHAYQRQRELLLKVQRALADVASAKGRLEAKTAEVREKLPQLEEQARRFLTVGQEDMARLALTRRQIAAVELQTLEQQILDVTQEEQRLSMMEQRLAAQIEAFFARQEVIAARYSAAEAQVRINEALGGVSQELTDLGTALEQAEQKTEQMQARASALDELFAAGVLEVPGTDTREVTERQLAQLGVGQAVEERLAALKRQLAEAAPPGEG